MDVTQDLVLNYLLEQRGKVRNSDLLKKFKPLLESPDPQEKASNRDLFKRYVNKIAVVRDEDGSKVVVLKKKYTYLLAGDVESTNKQDQGEEGSISQGDHEEEPGNPSVSDNNAEDEAPTPDHEGLLQEDISQPNSLSEPRDHGGEESSHESTPEVELDSLNDLVSATPCENESERESVCAIVARMDHSGPAPVPKSWSDGQAKDVLKPAMLPLRYIQTSDNLDMNESETTLVPFTCVQESHPPDLKQATTTPPVQQTPLSIQTRSPNVARRQLDNVGSKSPHIKRASKFMKVNEDHKYSDVVPLIERDHEWLVNATSGRWNHRLLGLMMIDSELADKRDFISGFSALHWAAKSGNMEMVKLLFDLSRKGGSNLNVNVRSFGGYTPLHIAAIHDHKEVVNMLVREYNAKVHIRDNSGRKPYQYLKKGSALQLRNLLKDPTAISPEHNFPVKRNSKVAASIFGTTNAFLGVISDDIAFHDMTRGLKKPGALNKFFTAPSGTKKKFKARDSYPSMSSVCEDSEEAEEVVGKRRPVSEFFTH